MRHEAYHITSENGEDRLDSTDNLEDAIRLAREWAREGQAGDPVVIEHKGLTIRQLVLRADGSIAEEEVG